MASYDIIGSIAILKFKDENTKKKKETAKKFLQEHKHIKTILEKTEKIKGRLRTYKTKFLLGKKTKETIHKENNCLFKLDVEKCYFSPRLSNERLEIARKISSKDGVLVLFAGVAPFSIVIAKLSKAKKVASVELNRIACKYAEENVKLNKLNNIQIIQKNAKKLNLKEEFDVIVMPRPNLKETFLKTAFLHSKKGTKIFYYAFGKDEKTILEQIAKEAKKLRRKIKILSIRRAGEIAPYKFRWLVEMKII